ncbi:MAG: hypothetical protein KAW17_06935 [Candidatus Eisenbacteria sp.]|nr:hypothetical protein [Candidatus Eisenbacteria bacterium]
MRSGPGADRGFAFVMALLAAVMVAGIATTLAVVSATESRISDNYIDAKQMTCLAEAGIQHGLWQLSQDPTNLASLAAQGLGAGKYDVVIAQSDWGRYQIAARGRTATALGAGIAVDVSVFPQACNYALVAKTYEDVSLSADIQGAILEPPPMDLEIDYAALLAQADWVFSGNTTFDNDFSFNGVIFVNGDLTFRGNTVWVEGTIVATHDIKVEPDDYAHFAGKPGMPALVAGNNILLGDSNENAALSIRGMVVAQHDITFREFNSCDVWGSVWAHNKVKIERWCWVDITWEPGLRTRPPLGILQDVATYSWALIPGTWQTLADLTPFDAL